ncbi:MAG: hypothetical protein BMS9Abin02_0438 [Anaerolineae bacterium]|nr:MAG: hypothetical protein BMS9Abin02_0438 [Anaerolineae bacterium]
MAVSFTSRNLLKKSAHRVMLLALGALFAGLIVACSSSSADSGGSQIEVESANDNSLLVADTSASNPDDSGGQEDFSENMSLSDDESSAEFDNSAGSGDPGGFSTDSSSENVPEEETTSTGNAPEPFPTMPISEENTHLETALALVPDDANIFRFTHWSRLKRHNRVPEMTSEYEMLDRKRFLVQVLTKNQAAAVMDKEFFDVQAKLWGWDSTDLVWEAEAQFVGMMDYLNILRVRPNLDLEELVNLLLESEFRTVIYEGVTIYSMPLTEEVEWYNISPLSIHNIAIFPDEDLLIMSPVIESVQRVIDTMRDQSPAIGDDPLVKRAAFQLVGMAAVEMQRGLASCEYYSAGNSDKGRLINAATEQLNNWPVSPYQLMALGHAFSNEAQVDLVLFHYDDFRQAELDFEFRENLIRMGTSPKRNVPYSAQFILQDSKLDDALMTFSLIPSPTLTDRSGWPQTVIGWVQDQDALFAACNIEEFLGLDEMN